MADEKITKIELSDGSIYSFFDKDAMHYDEQSGKILVGDAFIDNVLIQNNLFIMKLDDVPIDKVIDNLLTQDKLTGKIRRRDINKVLEDIGGCSYQIKEIGSNNGEQKQAVLSLKIGK